ncbi:probable uridine nucleosidase 2 isoform X1 [Leptopilina heterotoma]|uniref:probable uridine nucleosidase 2 isoform X1 n=2 Tax=Leptopilina heterotoma TaxID=63436 RepID=UPI001CA8DC5B|nr:probable uridine nucleosidase 2 isoform X1 [Leptopilina heterotoma]
MHWNLKRMKYLLLKVLLIIAVSTKQGLLNEKEISKRRKIIIDTDAGADDAVGILLALKCESAEKEIKILAITCTYGNTNITNVEMNVQKILTIAGREDIPIYTGAYRPLIKFWESTNYFGQDGLSDFEFNQTIIAEIDKSKHASDAMIHYVKKYPGEVTIIVLGPTTNIAMAINLDSEFVENIGQLVVMGSTVTGSGSVSPGVDFNFGCDPESNSILMNSTQKPIILVPREVSLSSPMYLEWRKNTLGIIDSSAVRFLNKAENIFSETTSIYWSSADSRTIAITLWGMGLLKTNYSKFQVIPVREGEARGSVLVDKITKEGKSFNALAALSMDVDEFKRILIHYLSIE